MSKLPLDANRRPIQQLKPRVSGGTHTIAYTDSSARNTVNFGTNTRMIRIISTTDCFFRLGTSTITAASGDHYLKANQYYDIPLDTGTRSTHIAAIRSVSSGTLYVSELE